MSGIDEERTHLTLAETARRLGECIWVEERLFEELGSHEVPEGPASVRVALAECSRRAAWRAEQLRARLPEVPGFAADDVVVAPEVGGLDEPTLDDASLEVVLDRAMPWLAAAYVAHLERCSPVADASVARTLEIVLADLRTDQAALETAL